MIIVTGPGRSGTSLVAALYRELGFDPGGRWNDGINAGLEAGDVVRANNDIVRDLGLGALGPPQEGAQPPKFAVNLWKRAVPKRLQERARSSLHLVPFVSNRSPGFVHWDRVDEIAAKHRNTLQEIAGSYAVVKDPRFTWTLAVWAAAGVEIDHVLICMRSFGAMVKSRSTAGHYRGRSEGSVKDSMAYGLGLCLAALCDYRLPYSIIRFPDFLEHPEQLHADMKFPKDVPQEDFLEAVAKVAKADLVHDRR